jgi:hypothetical protein
MASVKIEYAAASNLTITLASLATSSTWLAGQESTAVDNTTNKYLDYLLSGKITVGTTPTSGTEIRVYVVALLDDSTYPDVFDGTDSAETVTSAGVGSAFLRLAAVLPVGATTSNVAYYFGPVSVAALFGGACPKKFVVFVTHNTGVNLNSTGGNHQLTVTPVYATAA